ncbi:MocR-like transcription factor YczR [Actinomadura parmotrematis]|uniref:PLP-dependent aminotransferase family protein n=1 Tax=Actinomadura parmotrematis TaxID=2864039 RepID=A0ABS7FU99_9ACTN|nr:PLP-dependent aminotransferase family protein [Actinomadura parmotrematis]MBW8483309.1 PLP-dependent aminotransferase family protein [Actinomadura parmotrematis]
MSVSHVSGPQLARLLGGPPRGRPVYRGLARAVRALVEDGRIAVHTRLPAERDLAAVLGLSRTTVTAAYDRLRDQGYLESRQGAGSWTALPPPGGADAAAGDRAPGAAEVIDLGRATPGAPVVFDAAVAAAVAALPRHSGRPGYEPAGVPELREAIAARYAERGVPTRPDQIVVTTGAQSALGILAGTLLEPGAPVMVERPAYPHAPAAFLARAARIVPAGVNDGWDPELIGCGMRQAAARAAYLIPDFQNPTGLLMPDGVRSALAHEARANDTVLIADETFAELALDPAAPMPPPLAAHDARDRVISVGSASKLMWGGLRIGWIRATAPLARRIAAGRESGDMGSPVLEQLIVCALLDRLEEVRAERAAHLAAGRDALAAALRDRLPGWDFRLPEGGMALWARLEAPVASQLAEAAERHGVRVAPGPAFGAEGVLEDYVRLPYVLPPATLRTAVDRLADAHAEVMAAPFTRPQVPYV